MYGRGFIVGGFINCGIVNYIKPMYDGEVDILKRVWNILFMVIILLLTL
jgi:hypothetical protein